MEAKTKVVFEFGNPEAARHFLNWLSESAEEAYWAWMQEQEVMEEGEITVLQFDYDYEKGRVKTLTGRLDECR